jgi:hypothetical protein
MKIIGSAVDFKACTCNELTLKVPARSELKREILASKSGSLSPEADIGYQWSNTEAAGSGEL